MYIIHSFKVGRVGDEELFDVIQFTHSFQLEAQAKRSVAPCESGSLIRRILFVSEPWLMQMLDARLSRRS